MVVNPLEAWEKVIAPLIAPVKLQVAFRWTTEGLVRLAGNGTLFELGRIGPQQPAADPFAN